MTAELERARYGRKRGTGDHFVGFWLALAVEGRNFHQRRDARTVRRTVDKFFEGLAPALAESGEDAVLDALRDAGTIYWNSCATDPQYSSTLFGMKRLAPEELRGKAANEAATIADVLIQSGALQGPAERLPELITDAFLDAFADSAAELRGAVAKRPAVAEWLGGHLDG